MSSLPPVRVRGDWLVAEILAWQARWRVAVAGLGALVATAAWLLGALPAGGAADGLALSPTARLAAALALAAGYAVAMVVVGVRRGRPAGRGTRRLVAIADLALVFGLVVLLAGPPHWERALVLGVFSILVTQLYLGTGPALLAFGVALAGYAALLATGYTLGVPLAWGEAVWDLALFGLGGGVVALVHASRQRRLARLVGLFARLEEGDFAHAWGGVAERRPDGVSAVGRAYDRMRAQLATIVLTDPLTGCVNRRGFEQELARELARAERGGGWVALVAVDVDHFKRVNDEAGHLMGDAVLREVGAVLRGTARAGDVVARTGGEEFLLVLPATDAAGAAAFGQRVVEAFRAGRFGGEAARPVTVSVGVAAERVGDVAVAEDLKARADAALYAAKRGGRDRVVVWEPSGDRAAPVAPGGPPSGAARRRTPGGAGPTITPPGGVPAVERPAVPPAPDRGPAGGAHGFGAPPLGALGLIG